MTSLFVECVSGCHPSVGIILSIRTSRLIPFQMILTTVNTRALVSVAECMKKIKGIAHVKKIAQRVVLAQTFLAMPRLIRLKLSIDSNLALKPLIAQFLLPTRLKLTVLLRQQQRQQPLHRLRL